MHHKAVAHAHKRLLIYFAFKLNYTFNTNLVYLNFSTVSLLLLQFTKLLVFIYAFPANLLWDEKHFSKVF